VLTQEQLVFAKYGIVPTELLWSGRPATGIRFNSYDWLSIPFSLMWCGFAIFWETLAFSSGAPFFFRLWGIPFVLFGLYAVAGRFFWDAYRRSVTWYGLTSDAALIVRGGINGTIVRIYLPAVQSMNLVLRSDGSGTITFSDGQPASRRSSWEIWPGGSSAPSFYGVADARRVYEICSAAQRSK